jgi:hypothetical protein
LKALQRPISKRVKEKIAALVEDVMSIKLDEIIDFH